jgi:hypothetical protein
VGRGDPDPDGDPEADGGPDAAPETADDVGPDAEAALCFPDEHPATARAAATTVAVRQANVERRRDRSRDVRFVVIGSP